MAALKVKRTMLSVSRYAETLHMLQLKYDVFRVS
jgi:hypothetical protein